MRFFLIAILAAMNALAASHSYHTAFPLTENPISEGSQWVGGSSAGGSLWGDVRTTPGKAFGVSEPTAFGDPTAILTGTWGANQTVQGTVSSTNPTGSCCHEIELRLRMVISTNSISGYEAYCSVMPDNLYCHIARWNGPNGSYCNIESSTPSTYAHNGDILKATVTGTSTTIVTLFLNGTQVAQATDTGQSCSPGGAGGPFTSGNPGLGFYDNQDSTWTAIEFSDFWASDGVPVLDTTTATSITSSSASSGGTVIYNGGASVTDEGVGVGTSANPTTPCTGSGTSTPYTTGLSGLLSSTLYNYRACATNSNGTGFGPNLTFTTNASSSHSTISGSMTLNGVFK
jgi:hypothetical protein